jgi:excisionase family DNA binding protein
MGQARPDLIRVLWENPPGPNQALILVRSFRGQEYQRKVGPRGLLTQIEAAAVLGVSLMTVNRHVRSGKLRDTAKRGVSMIPLSEVKRFLRSGSRKSVLVPFLT